MNLDDLIRAQAEDAEEEAPAPPKRHTVSADPKAIANLNRILAQPMPRPPGRR